MGCKVRHPEANERRRLAYALGGVAIIAVTVAFAALAFTKPDSADTASRRPTYPSRPSSTFSLPPPTAFMPPPVMTRGSLAMIGYLTTAQPDGGLIATVYFWAPEVASKIPAGT